MNESNKVTGRAATLYFLSALGVILITASTGCTTAKVGTEHDHTVNFWRYKTFTVLPISSTGSGIDPGATLRLAGPAEKAVRDDLGAKGFIEVKREQADFAVLVRGESLPRVEVSNWGYTPYPVYGVRRRGLTYYGSSGYQGTDLRTTEDRKLIIEIYDNASHKQAWVGWLARSDHNGPIDPAKLQEGIHKILEDFPPLRKTP